MHLRDWIVVGLQYMVVILRAGLVFLVMAILLCVYVIGGGGRIG